MQDDRTVIVHSAAELVSVPTRRNFLKALGIGGTLVLMPSIFAACDDNNTVTSPAPGSGSALTISLGSDVGIFTFAAVLEQLESNYYERVVASYSSLFNPAELEMLTDVRNDEVTHREFLRAALGSAFPTVTFNLNSALNNATKMSLLTTALTLETNGVAAYNGAGAAIKNAKNLLVAGKIVSVEARHASALADAIDTASGSPNGTLYADLTMVPANLGASSANALDAAAPMESTVATNAQAFIVQKLSLTA
ncbi:hypothetical protein tb265_26790 [Gemmatimonadetes bacterium T265]|nr:hypothetical protein tb265_26790 [Gemmatimonadetes bacterium T265]